MICKFDKKLLSIWTDEQPAPWADKLDGIKVEFPDDARDMYEAYSDIYCILRCWCEPVTERTKELIIERQTEPEKCKKCGANTFVAKHKGPRIGWYCTRCGAWLRWIPQHNKKAKLDEPKQLSMEDFGITLPEERTQPAKLKLSSLYGEMQKDDNDTLPWE